MKDSNAGNFVSPPIFRHFRMNNDSNGVVNDFKPLGEIVAILNGGGATSLRSDSLPDQGTEAKI